MRGHDDSVFEAELRKVAPRPVFIIGLHRSGTTFLYQTLTNTFSVASLTAYHVLHYDRVLLQHREGTATAAREKLDGLFRSWGMATRRIDDVALSHAMLEEYGWVLRRHAGVFHTNARTAPLVDEICRKLHILTPSAEAVLLKNPWDAGHAGDLLAHFHDARFIFMQRDPVAIVNSQFRFARYSGLTKDPYLHMLLGGIPLGRTWMRLQRAVRKAAGGSWHGRIALSYILRDVTRGLGRLEASWTAVPPRRRVALDYSSLVRDPDGTLEKVARSLGLSPRRDRVRVEPNPRDPTLLPEVAAAEAGFRRRLSEKGITQRPLDEIRTP